MIIVIVTLMGSDNPDLTVEPCLSVSNLSCVCSGLADGRFVCCCRAYSSSENPFTNTRGFTQADIVASLDLEPG
ncbi:hypothetical protein RRG08_062455 [Elysia crispata]|uniref:Uncharacterized protein n=1 Tax=Elysia crispata TaxID=231223 RepID=A0AAE0XNK2_9GAST|nr:hypothetical protein RRG08_062455 [Elysia crispata]